MFLFKKIVTPLFYPLSLILGMLILGLIFMWFTKKQKTGKIIMTVGTVMLCFLSYSFFTDLILKPLENRYPPLMIEGDAGLFQPHVVHPIKWIVLLGGGHTPDPKLPATGQLSEESLSRLSETIRIHKMIPESKIILSGGAWHEEKAEAEIMLTVAEILGVQRKNIILDTLSKDTQEQAWNIKDIVGKQPFILVTSAFHMPRAMLLFTQLGLEPIPAPSHYLIKQRPTLIPRDFYPSSQKLLNAERAFHEYLGILWTTLRKTP